MNRDLVYLFEGATHRLTCPQNIFATTIPIIDEIYQSPSISNNTHTLLSLTWGSPFVLVQAVAWLLLLLRDRKESNRIRALYCRHSAHSVTDGRLKSSPCSLFAFSCKCRGRGPSDLSVFVYSVSDLINSPIEINNYPPGGGLLMVLVGHVWKRTGEEEPWILRGDRTIQYRTTRKLGTCVHQARRFF